MDARLKQKLGFSLLAIILLACHNIWPGFLADPISLGLLVLALLPWADSVIQAAELPGGWKIEFREVKAALARQQEIINALVQYSMSASIFNHLAGIALLRTYTYRDDPTNRRELYFLRDNGFIRPRVGHAFLDFDQSLDGQNLAALAEPTPIGWECVRLRASEIPDQMRRDAANLNGPLETLLGGAPTTR